MESYGRETLVATRLQARTLIYAERRKNCKSGCTEAGLPRAAPPSFAGFPAREIPGPQGMVRRDREGPMVQSARVDTSPPRLPRRARIAVEWGDSDKCGPSRLGVSVP